ncbi:MAG: glycosyltransferase family 4 protein [Chloroflexi bacterium]|nr:glycosyltransferase family 4 protein [Chloroflexota bacterium]
MATPKPRLLVMLDHFDMRGGGEVVASQLAQRLVDRFEVSVLTTDPTREERATVDGLPVYVVRSRYPIRLRPVLGTVNPLVLQSVRRILREFRPDVVHAWNVHEQLSYASVTLARRMGAATVLTFQDALPFCYTKFHCYVDRKAPTRGTPDYRADPARCRSCRRHYWMFPPRNRLNRLLLSQGLSATVAVSHALADALAQNGIERPRVIHNGLPLDNLPPAAALVASIQERFQVGPQAIVAGGRMSYFKGQRETLKAFGALADRYPGAQLLLAGSHDDWFGRALARQSSELGVRERVIFTGRLPHSDFLALLAAGALFANLSTYLDPFPTVNLEAGACGRPVLGTTFGGTPEVVLDGETGLLVDPFCDSEVLTGLDRLLADIHLRERLGGGALERIRTMVPMRDMVRAYLDLFASLA